MKILIFTFLGSTGFISESLAPGALLRIIEDLNWLSKRWFFQTFLTPSLEAHSVVATQKVVKLNKKIK